MEEVVTKKNTKVKKLTVWSLIVLLVGFAIGIDFYIAKSKTESSQSALEFYTVKRASIGDTILATGTVQASNVSTFYLDASKGEIKKIEVKVGEMIGKEDVLFSYNNPQLIEQIKSLKIQIKSINLQLNQRKNQISILRGQISDLEDQISRDKKTSNKDKKALGNQSSQLVQKKNHLVTQKESLSFQNRLDSLELEQLNAKIDLLKKQKDELVLKSDMAGVVQTIAKKPFNIQEPIVTIVSNKPYVIQGTLSEYDIVHVKKGQTVIIKVMAFGDKEWRGKVVKVGTVPEHYSSQLQQSTSNKQEVTKYPFTVAIIGNTEELLLGNHVTMEITVENHKDVLLVPHDAIITKQNKDFVFVIKDGKLDLREVKIGFVNDKYIEVKSGVQVGDIIVVNPTSDLKEGMIVTNDRVN